MWVFLNNAYLSAVAHRDKPDTLLVRARFAGDLERVFPDLADKVKRTPSADYLFRVEVPRAQFAEMLAREAQAIDYDNFKSSASTLVRHDVYLDVWHVLKGGQTKYAKRPAGWV